jgi:hypothetical protein
MVPPQVNPQTMFARVLELARADGDLLVEALAARDQAVLLLTGGQPAMAMPLFARSCELVESNGLWAFLQPGADPCALAPRPDPAAWFRWNGLESNRDRCLGIAEAVAACEMDGWIGPTPILDMSIPREATPSALRSGAP